MKSMKDFAAQQLTKKQMNEVKGGREIIHCEWIGADGFPRQAMGTGDTHQEATLDVFDKIPQGVDATCQFI